MTIQYLFGQKARDATNHIKFITIQKSNHMQTYTLKENVLSDNLLIMPDENKVFKGGYIAILKEYTFQNAWSDKESIKRFRSEKELQKYLGKNYPEFYY